MSREPPPEVIAAAHVISKWAEENNIGHLRLLNITYQKPDEITKIIDDFQAKVFKQVSENNQFIRECKKIPR